MFSVPNIPHIRDKNHYKDKRRVHPNAPMSGRPTVTKWALEHTPGRAGVVVMELK